MNKRELVAKTAEAAGVTKKEAERVLNAFFDIVKKGVREDGIVQVVGFGSWKVVKRKARKGVDPRTGKKITIPAKKVVKFYPGKGLKNSVS